MSPAAAPSAPVAAVPVYAAAGLAVCLWGATPVVTRFAVGLVDPLAVGLLRILLAAGLAPLLLAATRLPPPRGKRQARLLLLSAAGALAGFPLLLSFGLEDTSASNAALILTAVPLVTALFAAVAERRLPGRLFWLGAALAIAGEVALIAFHLGAPTGGGVRGDLLVAASGVVAAAGYVAGARLGRDYPVLGVTFWGALAAAALVLPIAVFRIALFGPPTVPPAAWGALIYLAIGATLIAYIAWFWALGQGGIARLGALQYAQPLVTLAIAAGILGERVTWPLVLAGAAILAGIALAQRR